jgi:hypothetical protein
MHLAQAKTRLPEGSLNHCKFGRLLFLDVGLYFPLNFTKTLPIDDFFLQTEQIFSAIFL